MKYLFAHPQSNAINFGMIMRILGQMMMVEAAFMILPLVVCMLYGEEDPIGQMIAPLETASGIVPRRDAF